MQKKPRILWIEDEIEAQRDFQICFKESFDIDFAKDLPQAVKFAEENQYDLINSDYNLGEGNATGIEAVQIIREMGITVPVLFITSEPMKIYKEAGKLDYEGVLEKQRLDYAKWRSAFKGAIANNRQQGGFLR